jgi:hypothetical protein
MPAKSVLPIPQRSLRMPQPPEASQWCEWRSSRSAQNFYMTYSLRFRVGDCVPKSRLIRRSVLSQTAGVWQEIDWTLQSDFRWTSLAEFSKQAASSSRTVKQFALNQRCPPVTASVGRGISIHMAVAVLTCPFVGAGDGISARGFALSRLTSFFPANALWSPKLIANWNLIPVRFTSGR